TAAPTGAAESARRTSSNSVPGTEFRNFRERSAAHPARMVMRRWLVLAALVALAPDTPGVIELWDDDELVYVGATRKKETLRTELEREVAAHAEATHFGWEITFDPE